MTDTRMPVPNPEVLFTELDDGTGVLLHLETKFYYTLNKTAVFVWKSLATGGGGGGGGASSIPSVAENLTQAFRVDKEAAERDVASVVEEMIADGLLIRKT